MIQGGDPLGNGTGGPGYKVVEKPPANLSYTKGHRRDGEEHGRATRDARAASSTSSPAPTPELPPEYALVGKVSEGIDVVEKIGKLGTPAPKNRNRRS